MIQYEWRESQVVWVLDTSGKARVANELNLDEFDSIVKHNWSLGFDLISGKELPINFNLWPAYPNP